MSMVAANYVIGVSGGVDSVALLDALAHGRLSELADNVLPQHQIIVAHFDHGIRGDSREDEALVRALAERYGLQYVCGRGKLGVNASEDSARRARYNFLRQCCIKYNAQLMTAHHQDDLLETMVINLIRGTGWRGLVSMDQISDVSYSDPIADSDEYTVSVLRPLLYAPKSAMIQYAKKYGLKWREDSTNADTQYLRNYVRHMIIPKMLAQNGQAMTELLQINSNLTDVKNNIATELQKKIIKYQTSRSEYIMPRYDLVMLPSSVAHEYLYYILTNLDSRWHPTRQQIQAALHFIKTGRRAKQMLVSKHLRLELTVRSVKFQRV